MSASRVDIAAFYWIALDSGLVLPEAPIRWADEQIAAIDAPDVQIIELSLALRRPLRQIMDALRQMWSVPTPESFRLFAGLLHKLVADGTLTELAAARQLYRLYSRYSLSVADVLGHEIRCMDDDFEEHMPRAAAVVREFLASYATVELPPLELSRA